MSERKILSLKSDLSQHINSKLFQKFLESQALKHSDRASLGQKTNSPLDNLLSTRSRNYNSQANNKEKDLGSSQKIIKHKSMSTSELQFKSEEVSPMISRKPSPLKDSRVPGLEIPEILTGNYDSNLQSSHSYTRKKSLSPKNQPIYTVDPLLLKQYETNYKQLEIEFGNNKKDFQEILSKKNQEIKRLQKINEKIKNKNLELMEKEEINESNERKIASLKAERESLEKKLHGSENDCDSLKRQLEYSKSDIENYKAQIEEAEKSFRRRASDYDKEIRFMKDKLGESEKMLYRETQKASALERKVKKLKDIRFSLGTELRRCIENNKRLEKEVDELTSRIMTEKNSQFRESHMLTQINKISNDYSRQNRVSPDDRRKYLIQEKGGYTDSALDLRKKYATERVSIHEENFEKYFEKVDPISWQPKNIVYSKKKIQDSIKNLEQKLISLGMDQKRYEDELSRIFLYGTRPGQNRRAEELELELDIIRNNIATVSSKLSSLGGY